MSWYKTGNSRTRVNMPDGGLVLDVGSGGRPHFRADVLLEKYVSDNTHRSGGAIVQTRDQQLVIGDAEYLPFKDNTFAFVIASHIAEHVKNPCRFCYELIGVGKGGYIETPSSLGETLLPEPFHRWVVHADDDSLIFEPNFHTEPLSEAFYRLFYYGTTREGHKSIMAPNVIIHLALTATSFVLKRLWVMAGRLFYTRFWWSCEQE